MREEKFNAVFFIRHLCHVLLEAVVAFSLWEDCFHLFSKLNRPCVSCVLRRVVWVQLLFAIRPILGHGFVMKAFSVLAIFASVREHHALLTISYHSRGAPRWNYSPVDDVEFQMDNGISCLRLSKSSSWQCRLKLYFEKRTKTFLCA